MKRKLWQEALVYKRELFLAAGFSISGNVLAIGQAFCFAYIINGIFLENSSISELLPWFYSLILIIIGRTLFSYWTDVKSCKLASRIKVSLREEVSGKIFELGPVRLSNETLGSLTNLLIEGVEKVEPYFSRFLPQLLNTAVVPIFTLAVVFYLNKTVFFIMLFTAPLIPIFMILIGKEARAKNEKQFEKLSAMSAHFLDVLQGLATLKLFGRSKEQAGVIARVSEEFQDSTLSVLKIAFLSALSLELVATISTAMVAVTVGLEVLYGHSRFYEAFFVLLLTPGFYLPFRQLGTHYHSAEEALAAGGKIYALLGKEVKETPDAPGVCPDFKKVDKISFSFENVSFTYEGSLEAALKGISFKVNEGEKVALVGPSGAGKSTVASLLLKSVSAQEGSVIVNGTPLENIKKSEWLANIAYVPQRPHLFSASIADNIRFGSDASYFAVTAAAKKAQIHDFIISLPDGYETIIGEGGRSLSGGETQRISLARAFLRQAGLVIFDEPVSAVDIKNKMAVTESIGQIFPQSTVLIITHCLKTILGCNRIIVLENGQVAGQGTHEELLQLGGIYKTMAGYSYRHNDEKAEINGKH